MKRVPEEASIVLPTDLEVTSSEYRIWCEAATCTVYLQGALRLSMPEYDPIWKLLEQVLVDRPAVITLHLRDLQALNSSGTSILYKFLIALRQLPETRLVVLYAGAVGWQARSIPNVTRFLPRAELRAL